MANLLIANTPFVSVGLTTYSYTIPSTGLYFVDCKVTVPSAVATGDGAGSGGDGSMGTPVSSSLVLQVKQNGTTIYTAPTITPTQSSLRFTNQYLFTAADVITVVLMSSNQNDQQLNSVRSTVSVGQA